MTEPAQDVSGQPAVASPTRKSRIPEDWWAVLCGALILLAGFVAVWSRLPTDYQEKAAARTAEYKALIEKGVAQEEAVKQVAKPVKPANALSSWVAAPAKWIDNPLDSFWKTDAKSSKSDSKDAVAKPAERTSLIPGIAGAWLITLVLFSLCAFLRGENAARFAVAYTGVFVLATLSYVLAEQELIKAYNLEYALWALMIGLIICNTIGTPEWLKPAVRTEFYIKTGLVLLGAEVLMNRLVALGVPGVMVSWVCTPITLVSTYIFGQRFLKMESKSLNMVISADMSVCGVSAAIATGAACKAKKEELSLAIGLSLAFTVLMMIAMPAFIRAVEMDETLAGAWLGGTIDSTGAVAAAGAFVGQRALEVATTVKMIQNILIGAIAFAVSLYWVSYVERDPNGVRLGPGEVIKRFPRFILGFAGASILFSWIAGGMAGGPELVDSITKGFTAPVRGWLFCLAFVSIGLETNFRELTPYFKGGKPLVLYVVGQTLNLILSFAMSYLMFRVVYRDAV